MGSKSFPKERADIFVDGKVMSLDDYKQLAVTGGSGGWKAMTMEKGQLEELKALAADFEERDGLADFARRPVAATPVSFEVERQIALRRDRKTGRSACGCSTTEEANVACAESSASSPMASPAGSPPR